MCFTCGLFEVRGPWLGGRLKCTGAGGAFFCLLRPAPGERKGELGTAGAPHGAKKQRLAREVVLGGVVGFGRARDSAETAVERTESWMLGACGAMKLLRGAALGVNGGSRITAGAVMAAVNAGGGHVRGGRGCAAVQWRKWVERGMGTGGFRAPQGACSSSRGLTED